MSVAAASVVPIQRRSFHNHSMRRKITLEKAVQTCWFSTHLTDYHPLTGIHGRLYDKWWAKGKITSLPLSLYACFPDHHAAEGPGSEVNGIVLWRPPSASRSSNTASWWHAKPACQLYVPSTARLFRIIISSSMPFWCATTFLTLLHHSCSSCRLLTGGWKYSSLFHQQQMTGKPAVVIVTALL